MRIRLGRLFTYPSTRVLARYGEITLVKIDGLVCDAVCAARSRAALRRLAGVRDVRIDFASGLARIEGTPHGGDAYAGAIAGVVAAKPLRRLLGRAGRHSERSEESHRRRREPLA